MGRKERERKMNGGSKETGNKAVKRKNEVEEEEIRAWKGGNEVDEEEKKWKRGKKGKGGRERDRAWRRDMKRENGKKGEKLKETRVNESEWRW